MASQSSELGLHRTAEGLGYTRRRNPISRVQVAARAGLAALALLAAGKAVNNPTETVVEPIAAAATSAHEAITNLITTQEQRTARNLLENAPRDRILMNLVVSGKDGANMRTKPATSAGNEPDSVAGEVRGKLKSGDIIPKAIIVFGGDPLKPMDRESRALWFSFQNPKNPEEIVFVWSGNVGFDQAKAASITPFELKNR